VRRGKRKSRRRERGTRESRRWRGNEEFGVIRWIGEERCRRQQDDRKEGIKQ